MYKYSFRWRTCKLLLDYFEVYSFYRNMNHYLPFPRDPRRTPHRPRLSNYRRTILPVLRNSAQIWLAGPS